MIFISEKKSEIVWNRATGKPLCQFVDGRYQTEDVGIIRKLIDLGYDSKEGAEKAADLLDTKDVREPIVEPVIEKDEEEPVEVETVIEKVSNAGYACVELNAETLP